MNEFGKDDLLKALLSMMPKRSYESVPNPDAVASMMAQLSTVIDVPISVVGSSVDRDLDRDPNDIDIMINTADPEVYKKAKSIIDSFSEKTGFKVDVLPSSGLDSSRASETFFKGRRLSQNRRNNN